MSITIFEEIQTNTTNCTMKQIKCLAQCKKRNKFYTFDILKDNFIFWLSAIVLLNLIPNNNHNTQLSHLEKQQQQFNPCNEKDTTHTSQSSHLLSLFDTLRHSIDNMGSRSSGIAIADAKVLGKMAKVWYIKKKLKKMAKKIKKHTIAVPVFTAIPIYEHSYYPHPQIMHHPMHHHHAASNQIATIAEPIASAQTMYPLTAHPEQQNHRHNQQAHLNHNHHQQQQQQHHQLTNQANHNRQQQEQRQAIAAAAAAAVYPTYALAIPHHQDLYGHTGGGNPNHIINAYVPQQSVFVDNTQGLYGAYNNAYGTRFNGGYQIW